MTNTSESVFFGAREFVKSVRTGRFTFDENLRNCVVAVQHIDRLLKFIEERELLYITGISQLPPRPAPTPQVKPQPPPVPKPQPAQSSSPPPAPRKPTHHSEISRIIEEIEDTQRKWTSEINILLEELKET